MPPAFVYGPRPDASDDSFVSQLPELRVSDVQSARPRKRLLPLALFLATCLSTFWVGSTQWLPIRYMDNWSAVGSVLVRNWGIGLTYTTALLAILLTHEMGHFLYTVRYKIPASFPIFIPVPFNAIGTMGAVIGMDGLRANRSQLFDLGLAGPLAGLSVAVPIMWIGIGQLDLEKVVASGGIAFHNPLLAQWMLAMRHPGVPADTPISIFQLNPFFMAGWVGLLITGLNMLPISQLDGGHVIYALFRKGAHSLARAFLILAIVFVVVYIHQAYIWTLMLVLVILMGTDHPPTSNDNVRLGPVRWILGIASLSIPVLCFPVWGIVQ